MRRVFIIAALVFVTTTAWAQLFSMQTRQTAGNQRFAMEFLEHYFIDLLTQKDVAIERRMQDDKVYFRRGGLNDLRHLSDTIPFTISLNEEVPSHYEVTWSRHDGEEPFVDLVFPAQYDLLLGISQEQAQKQLQTTISTAQTVPLTAPHAVLKPFNTSKNKTKGEKLFVSQTDTLYTKSLSNATYYDQKERPVFDDRHPDLSAANLFAGIVNADYELQVEQSIYGLKTVSYTLRLCQWLSYCSEWGLKTYFGIERQEDDEILALVIAHSSELGFNHLLSVKLPAGFTTDRDTPLPVRLTPYIPTHNVTNLFQQQSPNHKRIQWQ